MKTLICAVIFNQYRHYLAQAYGNTHDEAYAAAKREADRVIASSNPNFKWKKYSVRFHKEQTP